jgi:hypothetical protein
VGLSILAVQFRCIGMLGRHSPALLDMLPGQVSAARTAAFLSSGLVVSVLLARFVLVPALEAVEEGDPRERRRDVAPPSRPSVVTEAAEPIVPAT